MRLAHAVVYSLALGTLALAGCKQGVGDQCTQGSDCSSGYCNYYSGTWQFSMTTYQCTAGPSMLVQDAGPPPVMSDASNAADVATDAADAIEASASDVLDAASSDALDAASSDALDAAGF